MALLGYKYDRGPRSHSSLGGPELSDIPSGDTDVERLSMGVFCQIEGRNQFPKFEFSRQKRANHRVGDGLEVSGSEFRPDWPVGGRAVAI